MPRGCDSSASCKVKRFQTTRRDTIDGRHGSVVFLQGVPGFELFVSDKQTPEPRIYSRQGSGKWGFLGKIEDVE